MAQSSPAAALTHPVSSALAATPPMLPPTTPLGEALAAMERHGAAAILAVDENRHPLGILTEADVTRRIAFRLPPEARLADAMTAPVVTASADQGLWRAVALMRARGFRFLPVVDESGACIGLLSIVAALTAASGNLLAHLDALAGDEAAVKRAQAGLTAALLAEGLSAPDIVGLVSDINLDLHRAVLRRCLEESGTPPVPFTFLVLGSLGRGESLLRPDQDNALILGDYDDAAHDAVDGWFIRFAERLALALDAAGFPLCKGGVMARNPLWRKREAEWAAQFAHWAHRRSGAALLFSEIAFDFRAAWGDDAPAERLRAVLLRTTRGMSALLAALATQDARLGVALSLFGWVKRDEPDGRTDLKLHGLMPLASAARLLALAHGVAATGTPGRLDGLAALGVLRAAEAARLQAAFAILLELLLRQQLADLDAGHAPGSLVDVRALPSATLGALREALAAVKSFCRAELAELTGRLW